MESFTFLPQSSSVERLLKACEAALPGIAEPEKSPLIKAMREFENFGSPSLWSPMDVSAEGLTQGEKREVIARFIKGYARNEFDSMALATHARDVLAERSLHLRVEYDPLYTGGEYEGVGEVAYIPLSLIEAFAKQDANGDGVELAFSKVTKMNCMHIVNYTLDDLYNEGGEPVHDRVVVDQR